MGGLNMQVVYTHWINTAHRLYGYVGKCQRLHGHNYGITFMLQGKDLNDQGMLIDFGQVKQRLGQWLDDNWDHRLMLYSKDEMAKAIPPKFKKDYGIITVPFNPTAEGMAHYLLHKICAVTFGPESKIQVIAVEVEETQNCRAIATLDGTQVETYPDEKAFRS
jgi:6-pyruvoyltetrahydropterin/6-carboxytetrahydropterin synthase